MNNKIILKMGIKKLIVDYNLLDSTPGHILCTAEGERFNF